MGWIGVDLDGTLARYDGWQGPTQIGEPIMPMVRRVRLWKAQGQEVRIFTARAYPLGYVHWPYCTDWEPGDNYEIIIAKQAVEAIHNWCVEHIGWGLPITCIKDYKMWQLWDDRAVQVEQNTGRRIDNEPEGIPTP